MTKVSFQAGGPLVPNSPVCIERGVSHKALQLLRQMHYLKIIEPRQQGKTTLVYRLIDALCNSAYAIAYVDAEDLPNKDEAAWYQEMSMRLVNQFKNHAWCGGLPAPHDASTWRSFLKGLTNSEPRAGNVKPRLIIVLDEVGSVPPSWGEYFFRVLRGVLNDRFLEPGFGRLSFVLAGAVSPRKLIRDPNISPFNIARRVRLEDFHPTQVKALVGRLALPDEQLNPIADRVYYWTDGQPYMTQALCSYLAESSGHIVPEAVDNAVSQFLHDDDNHLLHIWEALEADQFLLECACKVVAKHESFWPSANPRHFELAHVVGIIKQDADGCCRIRNRIYEQAFPRLSQSRIHVIGDANINYKRGLEALDAQLKQTNRYNEFYVLEARLLENIDEEGRYGPSQQNRNDRARIIDQLNRLAMNVLGISFNRLSLGEVSPSMQASAGTLSLVRELGVDLTPSNIKSPVESRLQDLPFNQLSWKQVEALCAALVEASPLTVDCHLYGVQGDDQQGIDIVATQRGAEGNETWAYQCKHYEKYKPGKLKEAVAKMTYQADYYVLMLSSPATVALRQVADEEPNLFLWDAKDIARKLKHYPVIIEDFFGAAWRKSFCG